MIVGMRTDVLDGCPKAEGMQLLIRSMSPAVGGGGRLARRGFPGSGVRDSLWLHTSCDGAWKFTRGYHGAALFPETEKHAGF